ncbi:MAG TPA: vanadium-dependent haloperoxidase [Gemmatimonadales bacterium]|nr:vanadium-dependent haloperoxidase [Gemmatimonadales bacterium]
MEFLPLDAKTQRPKDAKMAQSGRLSPWRQRCVPALLLALGCGPSFPPADTGFVSKWTATHYALARAERLSPPVASRTSAYAAIALYEGWAAFSDSLRSMAGQLNGLAELPRPAREERYDPALVAMQAQTTVLRDLYAEGFASTGVAITRLHDSLLAVRTGQGVPEPVRRRSLEYGDQLGRAILAWAAKDGFAGRTFAYQPVQGDAYWTPTATTAQYRSQNLSMERDFVGFDNPSAAARPGESDRSITVNRPKRPNTTVPGINPLVALEPAWGTMRTFALDSAAACPAPPAHPFATGKDSPLYAEALEVYEIRRGLSEEQKRIAYFWADNPGESGTPAGHWMSVVSSLSGQWALSPERTVEAYALTAIAVADGFIGAWREKFATNLLRPVSYIQRYIDPAWQPLLITPNFPTYTSAHSTQSAAAAEVLTVLFGDNRAYDDPTHVTLGHPVKRLASFREAAREAGMSRLYGGIHFSMDNVAGRVQGECIGRAVLSRVKTRGTR